MKIQGPLVIDVSLWDDHLNIQELIDGGVQSVILGLYKKWSLFRYVLNDNCKRILDQVCASPLILQTYYYYYPQNDPLQEADWFCDQMAGYPVRYAWLDAENASAAMDPKLRSEQYRRFALELHTRFPNSGVYTANWFISANAPEMNLWLPHYRAWVSHYGHQPPAAEAMSWATLKAEWLPNYDIILAPGQLPAQVVGHQFTGDRCELPGVYDAKNVRRTLDVSEFTPAFMAELSGQAQPPVSAPIYTPLPNYAAKPGYNPNVHSGSGTGPVIGVLMTGTKVCVDNSVSDPLYSHFLPQTGFLKGGWVYKSYLAKL